MFYYDPAMDLLTKTYDLIEKSPLTYRQIADGASVDFNWFAKFKQRRINSPGVSKVQAVHDFLLRHTDHSEADDGHKVSRRSA